MMPGKRFWIIMAVFGTVIPWAYFGSFFSANGFALAGFVKALFQNGAAGGFAADVMLSILIFWVWSFYDARRENIRHWWLTLPAGFAVGLSLALPLYLALREPKGTA